MWSLLKCIKWKYQLISIYRNHRKKEINLLFQLWGRKIWPKKEIRWKKYVRKWKIRIHVFFHEKKVNILANGMELSN